MEFPQLILVQFALKDSDTCSYHDQRLPPETYETEFTLSPVLSLKPHVPESWSLTRKALIDLLGINLNEDYRNFHDEIMQALRTRIVDILYDIADHEGMVSITVEIHRFIERVIYSDFDVYGQVVDSHVAVQFGTRIHSLERMTANGVLLNDEEDITCAICLKELVDDDYDDDTQGNICAMKLPCNHLYHESCIARWLTQRHDNCPLCRSSCLSSDSDQDQLQD